MNLDQQREAVQAFTKKMIETIEKKGNDYAGLDRLSNFKSRAVFLETTTEKILLNDIVHKVTRLKEIINSGKTPENETLQDTLLDLSCYSFLGYCVLGEKQELKENDINLIWDGKYNFEIDDKYSNTLKNLIYNKHCTHCGMSFNLFRFLYKSNNSYFCSKSCFDAYNENCFENHNG